MADQRTNRFQEYTVGFQPIRMTERISALAIRDARFEVTPDMYSGDMIAHLTAYVAENTVHQDSTTTTDKDKLKEVDRKTTYTSVPSTWWDHAKATFDNYLSHGHPWSRGLRLWLKCRIRVNRDTITTTERIYMQTLTTTTVNRTVHMCPHMQPDRPGEQMKHVRWLHGELTPPNEWE